MKLNLKSRFEMYLFNKNRKSAFINAIQVGNLRKLKKMIGAPDFQEFLKESMRGNQPLLHALLEGHSEVYRLLLPYCIPFSYLVFAQLILKGESWKDEIDLTLNLLKSKSLLTSFNSSLYGFSKDIGTFRSLIQANLPIQTELDSSYVKDNVLMNFIKRNPPDFKIIEEAVKSGFKIPYLLTSRINMGSGRFKNASSMFKKEVVDLFISHHVTNYMDMNLFLRTIDLEILNTIVDWAERKTPLKPEEHYCSSQYNILDVKSLNPLETLLISINEQYEEWTPMEEWVEHFERLLDRFKEHGYHLDLELSESLTQKFKSEILSSSFHNQPKTLRTLVDTTLIHVKVVLEKIQLSKAPIASNQLEAMKTKKRI